MWHADCRAGTDKSLPTHPAIKSMQNFDWELATVQWGGGAMLFVRKGRGRVCWAIGWSTAQCWVPCSLYILCFSIQCVDRKRRDLKVTLTGVWNGHRGRRQCRDDTSCELFHIWAIINHGLRLGKRPQGGRPCGAGAVTCLLTDERSDPPTSPQWPLNP